MHFQNKIIIAIDGHSSCGKSTLAKALAKKLKYHYIDTGAMYRAVTLYFLRENVEIENTQTLKGALNNIHIHFEQDERSDQQQVYMNQENITTKIRDLIIAEKVSHIAAIKIVRNWAVAQQISLGKEKGVVMDGRDIGTVVFPDAELKIFMTADLEIRVKRRFKELFAQDDSITIEDVQQNLQLRDYIDSNREESPLKKADDALVLDNTDMSPEKQLQVALEWSHEAIMKSFKSTFGI